MEKIRKTDRRTIYTRNVIKDALIELLQSLSFEKITVAQICRIAEITRATFYLHYNSSTDVLNAVLDDAFELLEKDEYTIYDRIMELSKLSDEQVVETIRRKGAVLPVCSRLAELPKYRPIFMDETLSGYVVNRLYQIYKKEWVPSLVFHFKLSEQQAEMLSLFILQGVYNVNKTLKWTEDDAWIETHLMLIRFITRGCIGMEQK